VGSTGYDQRRKRPRPYRIYPVVKIHQTMRKDRNFDMVQPQQQQLHRLLETVQASSKYRHVDKEFILSIGENELRKRRSLKEAIKATRNKLHQVGGAYLEAAPHYARWLDELRYAAGAGDGKQGETVRAACRSIMRHHASTRERLPILERFYTTILSGIAPLHSVIDIACGLHPLAIPWMPLATSARYDAYDIYQDMMDFVNACLPYLGVQGEARACNVLHALPTRHAEVAFLLKAIPCLEQIDPQAGKRLLETVHADHLVVSFPAASLGGRNKGMVTNYEAHFMELVRDKPWPVERFVFPTELVFLIRK
jgi:16S rRNA (guanine(1405)-N(7))-methyltransferase